MSLFDRIEQRSIPTALLRDPVIAEWLGSANSAAGVEVTALRATSIMAVYAAVRLICETLAALPLVVLKQEGQKRERARSHPLYSLLAEQPNQWQTSLEWREMVQAHILLRGVGYNVITESRGGYPIALTPLHPDRVTPRHEALVPGGQKIRYYSFQPDTGPAVPYFEHELFIVRGLSIFDMLRAVDPIANARDALGSAIAAEQHGARFLANNVQPGGVFEHPGKLKEEAYKRVKADLEGKKAGTAHAGKTLILEDGMKWHQLGMTNKDAQFLELRKFSVSEVARMFKVPPHMLADLDRATFSNIEHQAIEFVVHTMLPWFVRWEQRISMSLLGPTERLTLYPKFIAAGLLRGDMPSRYAAYAIGRQWGWLSANDVRELEDMNPLPGDQGDIYITPLNMISADKAKELPATTEPEPDEPEEEDEESERMRLLRRRVEVAHVRLFLDASNRILRKEITAAQRAIEAARKQKNVAPLDKFAAEFYDADYESLIVRTLSPIIQTTAESIAALAPVSETRSYEALAGSMASTAARRHVQKQQQGVRKALTGTYEERCRALEALAAGWDSRASELAGDEVAAVSTAVLRQLPALTPAA